MTTERETEALAEDAYAIAHAIDKWNAPPRESLVLATLTRRVYELADGIRALADHDARIVAEAEARGAERVRARVEALVAKWSGCWCGPQMAYDHDPRVQDCPQHGDGAAEHFCGAIAADLRAALADREGEA